MFGWCEMKNKNNLSIEEMLKDYSKYIPKGLYCYDENGKDCPFWELKRGEYPEQEDGYCHYLKKYDWELNEEYQKTTILVYSKDNTNKEGKSVEELYKREIDPVTKKSMHFPLSLLWDQCKECGINEKE